MTTAPEKTALIVLGMHRSGTSALAGVLGHLGVSLPQDLMAPTDMNAKGFFESNSITGLNERLLASAGFTWWDPRCFPDEWFETDEAAELMEEAVKTLHDEFGSAPMFVIKDPRICRLMPFWREALKRFGARALVVHTHRCPWDVAASLKKWANYDTEFGLALWLRHVLDAESYSRDLPRSLINYESLIANWRGVVDRISKDLEIVWPVDPDEAGLAVEDFLSKDLQHFKSGAEVNSDDHALPPIVVEVLAVLEDSIAQDAYTIDSDRLDELRASLNTVSPLFNVLVLASVSRSREVAHHLKRIADLQKAHGSEMHAMQERNTILASNLLERQQELEGVREQLMQAEQALHRVEGNLGRTQDELRRKLWEFADQSQRMIVAEQRLSVANVQLRQITSRHIDEIDQRIRLALELNDATVMSGSFAQLAGIIETKTADFIEVRTQLTDEAERLRHVVHDLQVARDSAFAERDAARNLGLAREAELLTSTSWRVTAPLRRLSRTFRSRGSS